MEIQSVLLTHLFFSRRYIKQGPTLFEGFSSKEKITITLKAIEIDCTHDFSFFFCLKITDLN